MKLLSQIKGDLEFNRNLYNLTDALGKIAVSQYYVLEKKNKSYEKIFTCIEDIYGIVDVEHCVSCFIHPGNRPLGIIAVTSDSGLLGGLNTQVMNAAAKEMRGRDVRLIVIGEKGKQYAADNSIPAALFKGISDETRFLQAQQLRDYIIEEIGAGRIGGLKIIYPHPVSIISQRVLSVTLLPFIKAENDKTAPPAELAIESSLDDILGYLAHIFLGNKFYELFGLSRLSEMSARFVHLENSKTKIEQLNKQLRLQYFRQRHELTDRTMRELFTARLAFNK